jgi:hypothetical protein
MKSYVLKLTSAIVVDGEIVRAGSLVELPEPEAKNLLSRGKAVLATSADGYNGGDDDDETSGVGLSRLNKTQLQEIAKGHGIEFEDSTTKAQLIAAIKEKEADAE